MQNLKMWDPIVSIIIFSVTALYAFKTQLSALSTSLSQTLVTKVESNKMKHRWWLSGKIFFPLYAMRVLWQRLGHHQFCCRTFSSLPQGFLFLTISCIIPLTLFIFCNQRFGSPREEIHLPVAPIRAPTLYLQNKEEERSHARLLKLFDMESSSGL